MVRKGSIFLSGMHSEGLAGKTEIFVRYGVTERLELGLGYLDKQKIVRPLLSYILSPEKIDRPSLTAGAMVDSLEDGRQMVFLSAGKSFRQPNGTFISGYAGLARVTTTSENRFIGGVVCPLARRLNASLQFEGKFLNPGLTYHVATIHGSRVHFGIVAARGDRYGPLIAVSIPP